MEHQVGLMSFCETDLVQVLRFPPKMMFIQTDGHPVILPDVHQSKDNPHSVENGPKFLIQIKRTASLFPTGDAP